MTATREHALAAVALVLCLGCGAERAEAERVAALIDRMRDARGEAREPLLAELEKMAIEGDLARAARDSCAPVYRAEIEARRRLDAAQRELDGGRLDDALTGLEDATRALAAAGDGTGACNSKVGALKASIR